MPTKKITPTVATASVSNIDDTTVVRKIKKVKSKIYHLMSPDGVSVENLYTGEKWSDVKSAIENFTTDLIANVSKQFISNSENVGKKPDVITIRESALEIKKKLSGSKNIFDTVGTLLNEPGKILVYKNLEIKNPKVYKNFTVYSEKLFPEVMDTLDPDKLPEGLKKLGYSFRGGRLAKTNNQDSHSQLENEKKMQSIANDMQNLLVDTTKLDKNSTFLSEEEYKKQVEKYTQFVDIASFLRSNKYKPKDDIIVKDLVWKTLLRNVLRNETTLLVGESGLGKTTIAIELARVLERPFFIFNLGSTQEPRSALIGNTQINPEVGTYVSESEFVRAIATPGAIIVLDEISRANPEAWNILMSVLDPIQKYLRIDESDDSKIIKVAPGVSFIATANIGTSYTSTRIMDWALMERMMRINIDFLKEEEEVELIVRRFPDCPTNWIKALAKTAMQTRTEMDSGQSKLSHAISTRVNLRLASLMADGFSYEDSLDLILYPMFDADGGSQSERTYVQQIAQAHIPGPAVFEDILGDKTKKKNNISNINKATSAELGINIDDEEEDED
jgi:MoxR-like ATPase